MPMEVFAPCMRRKAKGSETQRTDLQVRQKWHGRDAVISGIGSDLGGGNLVWCEGGDFKCFNKNESQIHFTTVVFPSLVNSSEVTNTALVSAWQNQSLTSETEAQAVMEAICAFYLLSWMINGLSVRQLISRGFYGWPFVCDCKLTVQICVEAISYSKLITKLMPPTFSSTLCLPIICMHRGYQSMWFMDT